MESSNSTWTEYNQGREDDNQRRLAREQDLQDTSQKIQCAKKEMAFYGRGNQTIETDKGTKSKKTLYATIWNLIL